MSISRSILVEIQHSNTWLRRPSRQHSHTRAWGSGNIAVDRVPDNGTIVAIHADTVVVGCHGSIPRAVLRITDIRGADATQQEALVAREQARGRARVARRCALYRARAIADRRARCTDSLYTEPITYTTWATTFAIHGFYSGPFISLEHSP
jgi:hypothetical protein